MQARGAFGTIKGAAQAMNQKEDVLEKVVGLGWVAEHFVGYSANNPSVTAEENSQGFSASCTNLRHQGFVRGLRNACDSGNGNSWVFSGFRPYGDGWKLECNRGVHKTV
jgi:hypothetical protein